MATAHRNLIALGATLTLAVPLAALAASQHAAFAVNPSNGFATIALGATVTEARSSALTTCSVNSDGPAKAKCAIRATCSKQGWALVMRGYPKGTNTPAFRTECGVQSAPTFSINDFGRNTCADLGWRDCNWWPREIH